MIISAKRTFKGFSEEQRMLKVEEFISLSEVKTVFGRFSIDWTQTKKGIKIQRSKQDCLDCDKGKVCSDCVRKPKTNCFNCEMKRSCETCVDQISQNKTFSMNFDMLKRKPANEYHQMIPYFIGEYEPKQNKIDFDSAREILM